MKLPFSSDEFLDVFGQYNSGVWPMQFGFCILAVTTLLALFANHSNGNAIINLVLFFFWLGMGIVYHIMYFSAIVLLPRPLVPCFNFGSRNYDTHSL